MQSILAISPPGGAEIIGLLVIVILLFGAKKLPELGASVGKTIKNFKRGIEEGKEEPDPDELKAREREERAERELAEARAERELREAQRSSASTSDPT